MALETLIKDEMAKQGLSFRRAAERSNGRLTYSNLNRIARGLHVGPISDDMLESIALALAIPLARVRREAAKPSSEAPPFELPEEARYLTPEQRRAIITVINGMLSRPR